MSETKKSTIEKAIETFMAEIESAGSTARYTIERASKRMAETHKLAAEIERIEALVPLLGETATANVVDDWRTSTIQMQVTLRPIALSGCATEFLRAAAKEGFRQAGAAAITDSCVSWSLVGPDGLAVRVEATPARTADAKCRRVKVGTKTVEQDVYELVCDDGPIDTNGVEEHDEPHPSDVEIASAPADEEIPY